jgi:tRNA-modifying protein YgfZ
MVALALPLYEMSLITATPGYIAMREQAARVDASSRGRIRVTGDDRARLLHAMTTNNIQALVQGQGCYTFFLNAQGRILADAVVWCFEDHLLLDTEPEQLEKIREHLDRYIIADDVTLEDVTERTGAIQVEGPESVVALVALGAPIPEAIWSHQPWGGVEIQRTPHGFMLIFPKGEAPAASLIEATEDDARTVRIEQGRPRYGEEITERYLVQEAGLVEAVSYSKGCYLGQEIVERVRSRGQVHRLLRSIEIDTENIPSPGEKLTSSGTEAGEIVSAVYSPALEKIVALAYVRTPSADTGAKLNLDGFSARVVGPARL